MRVCTRSVSLIRFCLRSLCFVEQATDTSEGNVGIISIVEINS